jgi:hypothetical protein
VDLLRLPGLEAIYVAKQVRRFEQVHLVHLVVAKRSGLRGIEDVFVQSRLLRKNRHATLAHGLAACAAAALISASAFAQDVADRFKRVTASTPWTLVSETPVRFDTYHPQGFARASEELFLSSVEVIDRAAGVGKAHLFRMTIEGSLVDQLDLTDGPRYHPGGIDFDGMRIWVSVAEYRPDSSTVVYAIDPGGMNAQRVFTFEDHLGAIAHDAGSELLVGMSWGSRRLYRWRTRISNDGDLEVIDPDSPEVAPNPAHYVDFQDVQWAPGTPLILCGGLKGYPTPGVSGRFALGGLELVNSTTLAPVHQVPVALWDKTGRPMLQNPFHAEPADRGLRFYFMPADNTSTLFVYEVVTEG